MKRYVQFYTLSTGYVPGTIPPQFSPEHVKPIEALGSDSIAFLDGRYGLARCIQEARDLAKKRGGNFCGYKIMACGVAGTFDGRPLTGYMAL